MTENNDIITVENANQLSIWSSIKGDTQGDRLKVFAAVQNAESLDDHIGEEIRVRDIVMQDVEMINDNGVTEIRKRIVLIDDEGSAYACVSRGVQTAIANLIVIVGEPTWEPAIPFVPTKKPGNNGYKYTTLIYNGE